MDTGNTGIPTVDKIFVINLNHNTDRLYNFSVLMNKLNYQFERFEAVNGQLYKPDYLSPGEYGCYLSHKSLWEKIANDPDIKKAIIFEDDVDLSEVLEDTHHAGILIEHYVTNYTYDIFYLGKFLDRCDFGVLQGPVVLRSYKPLCAHAYVLTKEGAISLLNCVDGDDGTPFNDKQKGPRYPADGYLDICIEKQKLLVYAAHPSIFNQNTVCFNSNMRSKLGSLVLNTKECCVPQCANHIYIFIALVSVIFIIVVMVWSWKNRKR